MNDLEAAEYLAELALRLSERSDGVRSVHGLLADAAEIATKQPVDMKGSHENL